MKITKWVAALMLIGGASLLTALVAGGMAQERPREWGETGTVELERGQKLVTVTWRKWAKTRANLWVLTRPMRANEAPETYTFKEPDGWGLMEGTVIVKESR